MQVLLQGIKDNENPSCSYTCNILLQEVQPCVLSSVSSSNSSFSNVRLNRIKCTRFITVLFVHCCQFLICLILSELIFIKNKINSLHSENAKQCKLVENYHYRQDSFEMHLSHCFSNFFFNTFKNIQDLNGSKYCDKCVSFKLRSVQNQSSQFWTGFFYSFQRGGAPGIITS